MKSIKKNLVGASIILITFFTGSLNTAAAQTLALDQVKSILDSKNYIFKADELKPLRGTRIQLSGEYSLKVFKDTLIAYLPYFGRAFSAPLDPSDAGIKFTSTDFTYSQEKHRKNWDITFTPTDAKDVKQLILSVFDNGYATLQVNSIRRDPVTFSGYIVQGTDNTRGL
jgi:hypothetical protein